MPRVSVVIPTWNGVELLLAALDSLRRQEWRDFETIVVDNNSTDSTVERVATEYPEVHLVSLPSNEGFASAVNAGIRAAQGEILVLMNNDTEAEPGWLGALVRAMEENPQIGMCASKMLQLKAPSLIDSVGDGIALHAYQVAHGEPDGEKFSTPRYVLSACAGASAYRRELFDEIGLFDERYFAYFEDVDIGIRSQFAGHKCMYVPDAVIYHHGSATSNKIPERKFFLLMRNALILYFQYMPPKRRIFYAPLALGTPLGNAWVQKQPVRVLFQVYLSFLKELPAIRRRRRSIVSTRRISWKEYEQLLEPYGYRQAFARLKEILRGKVEHPTA